MYNLTVGFIKENIDNGQLIEFKVFKELVDLLKDNKEIIYANKSIDDNTFKMCIDVNSKVIIISLNDGISLLKLKEKLANNSYFISNNFDNGKLILDKANNLRVMESFNVLIPLSRIFNNEQEMKDFYKSLSKYLEVRIKDNKSYTMPTKWLPTTKGYNANETVIDLDITQYKKDLDVDNIFKLFPIETKLITSNKKDIKVSYTNLLITKDDINENKQLELIDKLLDKSMDSPLYDLACNLQELNLDIIFY